MKHLFIKYFFIGIIVLVIITILYGIISAHETDAYLGSVDAFIQEVER